LGCFSAAVYAAPKPNIVHILVDDFGWQDPVCFDVDGDTPFETPNIDRLATRGRKFMQAYSPAPTCAPSRAAYISGQYPAHTGIYHVYGGKLPRPWYEGIAQVTSHINPFYTYRLPLSEGTIPKELKKAGYSTAHVGKWHLGGRSNGYPFPGDYGFDISYTEDLDRGGTYYPDPDIWGPRNQIRNQHAGLASSMKPDRLHGWATNDPDDPFQLDADGRPFDKTLDVALKWLDKHHAEPFFLNYCTYYVHAPIQTRNRERFEYYCKKLGYEFPTDPGTLNKGRGGKTDPYYATMVDTLDWMVGKVITYLEETDDPRNPGHKLVDNTYIIVSSDNGGVTDHEGGTLTDNSPLRGGKQNIHEGGVRIPFIVCGPTIPKNSVCDTPISLVDLYPTFIDLVGLPPSDNPKLDGCNIRPLLEGNASVARFADGSERESLYFYFPSYHHAGGALRKGPWKIYRNVAPGINSAPEIELFRLYNEDGSSGDLGETVNLADAMPELCNQLLAELDAFLDDAKVTYPYKDPNAVTQMPGQDHVPAVLERGADGDRIWCTVETGSGQSTIVDAKLLYTVNGGKFDYSKGRREMWFDLPATIEGNRIEGVVPPGTSHAIFCMTDSEGYLVTSEPLPSNKAVSFSKADSSIVKHAWPFRPGLFALIKLGEEAAADLSLTMKKSDDTLDDALANAKAVYATGQASDEVYYETIRTLRHAILDLKGTVSQADNYYLNLFRPGAAF
jgi:arylsulfatase A-like enzyme